MYKFSLFFLAFALLLSSYGYAELDAVLASGPVRLSELHLHKRAMAKDIASCLAEKDFRNFLFTRISGRNPSHDLVPLMKDFYEIFRETQEDRSNVVKSLRRLDKSIREIKGISGKLSSILEIRLAFPERKIDPNEEFLVAYLPRGNDKNWKHIEAFDASGNVYTFDAYKAPDKPILIVGLNAKNDMKAGLELLNELLAQNEMQFSADKRESLSVAKLDYIRLEDDKEPWASGDAEIYALVSGIAPAADKANILAVEMPYLVSDKQDYHPGQVLIVWKNYRYMAANVNFYEHDDNTNYKEIAALLIKGIGQIVPEYNFIFEIASQIIKLMPDSVFTNDDDYVDVFYTLEKDKTYTEHLGASKNAKITLVPYTIPSEK